MPHKLKKAIAQQCQEEKKHVESKLSIQYYQIKPACYVHQHTKGQKLETNALHLHLSYNQFQSKRWSDRDQNQHLETASTEHLQHPGLLNHKSSISQQN